MPQETRSVSFGGKTTQTPVFTGHTYILTIGIDQYSGLPKLRNAVKDARDVTALLTSKYQFESQNVITLFDADATQGNIFNALGSLIEVVKPEDIVLIYFAGHGILQNNIEEGYWIPVDGERNNYGSFIANSLITKYLKSIKSLHTLVVADACFAGAMFGERDLKDLSIQRQEKLNSRWLLTSCRDTTSIDAVNKSINSPFADSLLLHLKTNEQDALPVTTLAKSIIYDLGNNYEQLPRCAPLYGVGDRGGEFVFRLKGSKVPDIIDDKDKGKEIILDNVVKPVSLFNKRVVMWVIGALIIVSSIALSVILFGPSGLEKTHLATNNESIQLTDITVNKKDTFSFTVSNVGKTKAVVNDIRCLSDNIRLLDTASVEIAAKESHTFQAEWTGRAMEGIAKAEMIVSGKNIVEQLQISVQRQVKGREIASNTGGSVPPESDANTVANPQKTRLVASTSVVDLKELVLGTEKKFRFSLKNNGSINAVMTSAAASCPSVTVAKEGGNNLIQPAKSVSYIGTWKANQLGVQECTITIGGSNLEQAVKVVVRANVKILNVQTSTVPITSMCKVTCRANGKRGVTITLVDADSNKDFKAITDDTGEADFMVPCDLMAQTIKVYVRMPGGATDNFNTTLQRFITIPD